MPKIMNRRDIALIVTLLITGAAIASVFFLSGRRDRNGSVMVQVRVEKEITAVYSLTEDRTVTIDGKDGGTNLLIIRGGEAFIEEASCPDKLCVHMGKIRLAGQSIVCLPNEVVIELVLNGTASGGEAVLDAVSE